MPPLNVTPSANIVSAAMEVSGDLRVRQTTPPIQQNWITWSEDSYVEFRDTPIEEGIDPLDCFDKTTSTGICHVRIVDCYWATSKIPVPDTFVPILGELTSYA